MKKATVLLLILALILSAALPFALPSGALLQSERDRMQEEIWEREEASRSGLLSFLLPRAKAEKPEYQPLPIDFSEGPKLKPAGFTDSGYLDDSIELRLETREQDGVEYRIAFINIAHPSQLRTATAGKPGSSKVALISSMAKKYNAVLAINANYYSNDPVKTSYEYRMGEKIRNKPNPTKDLLIIDEKGDFKLIIKSDPAEIQAFLDAGHQIVNAFTFGPALVKDSQMQTIDPDYGYNPMGREPRLAIGQMAELSYVIVLAEGRKKNSQGVTQQELAQFMADLGCVQAFNLDGGNSATMVFNGKYYQRKTKANERGQSDMIYFASLVGN